MCEKKTYGDVINSTILKIFGDELSWFQLRDQQDDEGGYTKLVVEMNIIDGYNLIRAWFDDNLVLDTKYKTGQQCDMYYWLEELDNSMS